MKRETARPETERKRESRTFVGLGFPAAGVVRAHQGRQAVARRASKPELLAVLCAAEVVRVHRRVVGRVLVAVRIPGLECRCIAGAAGAVPEVRRFESGPASRRRHWRWTAVTTA